MGSENYIIDQTVPINQDFRLLKQGSLDFIHECTGNAWTNLNASDPGITILDQLCYALTELGYCNDFSIGDILTQPNGKLNTRDNFYQPEKILTTSPVTPDDYRKYIIDAVAQVDNVIIKPVTVAGTDLNIYQCYLLINEQVKKEDIPDICLSVNYLLNKSRNINEFFADVLVIRDHTFLVNGQIEIQNESNATNVLSIIHDVVKEYIFKTIKGSGYNAPYNVMPDEELYDGPLLKKGWISSTIMGGKKDTLQLAELINIIGSVSGVKTVSISKFVEPLTSIQLIECVTTNPAEIIAINFVDSISKNLLTVIEEHPVVVSLNNNLQPDGLDNPHTALPGFTYRDINKYYSIQNTFPEIFAVGANTVVAGATDFQIAGSRQLKGYLTLFDQLLANQFSQLANIGKLFSFKNPMSGIAFEMDSAAVIKTGFEKYHPEYPAPYLSFPSTYFYQPLYNVPHIKPLLKDNETFMFGTELQPQKILEKKSWDEYMKDPYNPYMRGLMESMEDEKTSLRRRNDILDQLLARHGESPMLINLLIEGSKYAGNKYADQVIFKSLYLQNLGLLSYYRMKAYNFPGAQKIISTIPELPADFKAYYPGSYDTDFIFNSSWINNVEKLKEQDFINFSSTELKLSLLFGLKPLYRDFITNNLDTAVDETQMRQALWMIEQRRGVFFIETGLLLYSSANETVSNNKGYASVTNNNIVIILPDFINLFKSASFKRKLEIFLQNSIPVTISYDICFANSDLLATLIPAFANWHNSLIYRMVDTKQEQPAKDPATSLIKLITAIKLPA